MKFPLQIVSTRHWCGRTETYITHDLAHLRRIGGAGFEAHHYHPADGSELESFDSDCTTDADGRCACEPEALAYAILEWLAHDCQSFDWQEFDWDSDEVAEKAEAKKAAAAEAAEYEKK